jgi:hypothetical protein
MLRLRKRSSPTYQYAIGLLQLELMYVFGEGLKWLDFARKKSCLIPQNKSTASAVGLNSTAHASRQAHLS